MKRAHDYEPEGTERVRAACLYLATKLGDLADQIVIVGGLVPTLLVSLDTASESEPHVGTNDLDLGLAVGLLESARYGEFHQRLLDAGFIPDTNEEGNTIRQRWVAALGGTARVTVDLLIDGPVESGGKLQDLKADLAAIITPGLSLAFEDSVLVELTGLTLLGEPATRAIQVAGPAAYTVLKLLAFRNRGANKDAYDLYYLLLHHPDGLEEIGRRLSAFRRTEIVQRARETLVSEFETLDHTGPRRVAEFLHARSDPELQADVAGVAAELLAAWTTDGTG